MSDSVDRRRRLLLGAALSGVAGRALRPGRRAGASGRAPSSRRMEPLKHVDAGVLNIAYYEEGPADGPVAILLHGFPYDIHTYVDVAPQLAAQGCRVIVPYLARLRRDALSRSGDASFGRAGGDRRRCHRADGCAGYPARRARRAQLGWPRRLRRRGAVAGALPRHGDREQLPDPGPCARDGADQPEI